MRRDRTGALREHVIAAAWGGAEATFFFIVPDVWLSRIALTNPRRAVAASVSALGGALAGGVLTYRWGRREGAAASARTLSVLPAISARMVAKVEADMARRGTRALLFSFTRGEPYKVYARTAGLQDVGLGSFLAMSVPARMFRFLAVPLGVAGLAAAGRRALPQLTPRAELLILGAGWAAFYAVFFRAMGRDD